MVEKPKEEKSRTATLLNNIESLITEIEEKLSPVLMNAPATKEEMAEEATALNKNLAMIAVRLETLKERIGL